MSLSRILLTGGTGSVGAHVLEQLLSLGNVNVTVVVRSLAKSRAFLEHKYPTQASNGLLQLLEIPDLSAPHAFDAAAGTVDAIIHIATPLAYSGDLKRLVIEPTWTIDENILNAAKKASSVKRVIITGSIVSTMNILTDLASNRTITEADYNGMALENALGHPGAAYMYGKTIAERKAWAFMAAEKPGFDLVVLLAPSITGRCIQEGFVPNKTALGGMASIYNALFDVEKIGFTFPYFMDVEDVAAIHVKSLDVAKVPGNERYLFHAGVISANWIANRVRETYPELKECVPAGGEGDGFPEGMVKVDTSNADKVFGTSWMGWWESAHGTVKDILAYERHGNVT